MTMMTIRRSLSLELSDKKVYEPSSCQAIRNMRSGFEAGSYSRLIDFVYHSTLGLKVITKKKRIRNIVRQSCPASGQGRGHFLARLATPEWWWG